MNNIIEPTMDYDFSTLYLGTPTTLAGGAYFTKLMYDSNKRLLCQTPKSLTKQGFIKSGKKIYTDLMFDNNDTVFINWIENLETKCQELIFTKGQSWFDTKLEKDDIESAFTSAFKIFKSGKYYVLRVNVNNNIKIYDENDQIINSELITSDNHIISILEIQGIKFSSRNFQIEIELKQTMIVSSDPFLDECFIKKPLKGRPKQEPEPSIQEQVLVNLIQEPKQEPKQELEPVIQKLKQEPKPKEISTLDDFINKSAMDLAININTLEGKKINNIPIDLEVSFETPKVNKKVVTNTNIFDELEEANIVFDIEEPPLEEKIEKEDPNILKEFDVSFTLENNLETIKLTKPKQVYYEIYQKAREKSKEAKKNATIAYLEMKNIKKTYMLDDINDSDSDSDDCDSKNSDSDVDSLEDTF